MAAGVALALACGACGGGGEAHVGSGEGGDRQGGHGGGPSRGQFALAEAGGECSAGADCKSSFCFDGVCCRSDCSGACQSCAVEGSIGTCTNVPVGADPRNDCPDDGVASCGRSGSCDGTGTCALYAAGTICHAQACTAATVSHAARCDGAGTCGGVLTDSCGPYMCNAAGDGCRADCASDADCVGGAACVNGSCGPKPPGAACAAGSDCASAICAQGVCCTSACSGTCRSCAIAGSEGRCIDVPAGTDPLSQCADDGAASCGKDGTCDGAGVCHKYAQGTVCAAGSCTGSTRRLSSTCDGAGTCIAGSSLPCAPFTCGSNDDCRTTCSGDAQCVSPATCVNGSCGRFPIGAACGQGADCDSGFCAQGICCASDCTTTCKSCALAGSLGSCVPVPAGADPLNQCQDTGANGCDTDGACDGNGACRKYAGSTVCAAASCNGNDLTQASTCNGAGTCSSATVVHCSPYACTNGACGSSCGGAAGCAPGFYCQGTTCVAQQTNGASCGGAGECASGNCVDGVCCNDACAGACAACNVAGQVGSCTPIPPGQDPGNECPDDGATSCGRDGSCDGAGACRQYASGTVCSSLPCTIV